MCVATVVIDEFYTCKNITSGEHNSLAQLAGRPQFIAMSATPYLQPVDMFAITTIPMVKYLDGLVFGSTPLAFEED